MPTFINRKIEKSHRNSYLEKKNREITLSLFLLNKKRKKKRAELLSNYPIRCYKNVCFLTGEFQSVTTKFSLARNQLRKHVAFGFLPMVTPSSW